MTAEEEHRERTKLTESMIRLEAKIDVVLSQHEGKIDDLTRRQGETSSTLREHDSRITANALTIAETRSQSAQAQVDVQSLRNDVNRDVAEAKQLVADSRPKNIPVWIAVGISALAVVISPILTALMTR
jgi:hypothetical protein